ncbi:MAG: hypothetical protein R3B06_19785 [Kofleriaceae bacterium]
MIEPGAARAAAEAALASGDAGAAFAHLRGSVTHPARLAAADVVPTVGLLARIFAALDAPELARAAAHCADAPDDVDGLYDLGYHLIEDGLPGIAAVVLTWCHALAPGVEHVVTELCAALEADLAYGAARAVLDGEPALVAGSFLCRYLLAFNAAMSGDVAAARDQLPALVPGEPDQVAMRARIAALVARADALAGVTPLDGDDLRGWHAVVTGGILLHRSPFGLEHMRGRYALCGDTWSLVAGGLDGLRRLLTIWDFAPPCVYAPPGRDHQALGLAAAAALGVPLAPWPEVGAPAPGLVVVYDLTTVAPADLERVVERRAEQLLFAHACAWTEDARVAPDVVTLLYQVLIPPWGGGVPSLPGPVDARPAEALAADIGAATVEPEPAEERAAVEALARAIGRPGPGRRERSWAGGPVLSNRFR